VSTFFSLGLRLIVLVLNDPHSALTREPVPHVGNVLQVPSLFWCFHLSRQLTTLGGLPFVFRDFPHGGPPTVLKEYRSDASSFRAYLKRAGDSIDPSALRHFLCALQQRVVFAQRPEV